MASPQPTDGYLKQDQANAPVHTFNPDDTPAQKAAVAGQERDKLASMKDGANVERELGVSNGAPSGSVVPTIVIEDHDGEKLPVSKDAEQEQKTAQDSTEAIPGALPSGLAPAIPDWYIVGWRQATGIDKPIPEGEEKDKAILSQFIHEQFYGEWYHNAAVIVAAVIVTYFLARFGFGWGWVFIVLAFCSSYYSQSMTKFRRHARDDIQRELVKVKLGSEHETTEWMNQFLQRFWLIYEPILSQTIVSSVDQILAIYTPGFLDSLKLSEFTLGTKAPRIDKVRTFPTTDDDIVMMDWAFSFTPHDTTEPPPGPKKKNANPKIVLSIRIGKGLATAALPVLVENIAFSGLMRVRLKLVSNFPHVQTVDMSFLEEPTIAYDLKPIGGDFGMDITNIPGLSSFIRDTTHSILRPMMYDPNVFTLNLEQLLSGKPLDAAIGVVQVTIHSARGIKGGKIGGGTPDPFVSLSLNERAELARTKWKHNTYNPTWVETKYLLVNNLHERLVLDLYDYNDHRSHTKLSSTTFELSTLEEDSVQEGVTTQLLKEGKERGELHYDVSYYPIVEASGEGGTEFADSSVGVVRLTIHQAKELDHSKSISGELNPMSKLYLNGKPKPAFITRKTKHTNSPVWEEAYEYLCSSKNSEIITVRVIDDRDFLKDPCVGYMSVRLVDLIESKKAGKDWFPLSQCKSGKIRVSAEWKPVAMAGSLEGADSYTPPIGVVRLWLQKAVDVKNVEATLGGKSDPYVRVQVRNVTKARTEVVNNNLNPVWDEIVYVPIHSLRESLLLEAMDYQHLTKDRSLGTTELRVSDLAVASEDTLYPYESTGVKEYAEQLRLNKGGQFKGTLHYHAQFIPSMKIKGVKFDSSDPLKPGRQASNSGSDHEDGEVSDRGESDDEHFAPVELTIKPKRRKTKDLPRIETTNENGAPIEPVKAQDFAESPTAQTATVPPVDPDAPPMSAVSAVSAISTASTAATADGVEIPTEELLKHQSGIIVFNVKSGHLGKKGRIEVLMDDGYWPCFATPKSRSTHATWDYVGEGFLKEIDFGQVWLRLDQSQDDEKDDIAAEWVGEAKDFLASTLSGPQTFTLSDKNGDESSTVVIETRYIPVPVQLEPRESCNNQGIVRVELVDAHDLRAADRSGKSDPFAVFTLNDSKVYKSETKKKTLKPEWNESFEATVPSRAAADFTVELFDWNQIEQAKSLGEARIDLANIEPFEMSEQNLPLSTEKYGQKGYVRVRLVFQPAIIAKSRKNTSTLTTTGRALTQIGGLPARGATNVLSVFKRGKNKSGEGLDALPEPSEVKAASTGQASKPVGTGNEALNPGIAAFPVGEKVATGASIEPGTLTVTVVGAKDLASSDWKPYATLRIGDKEQKTKHTGKTSTPEWNENFKFTASSHTQKAYIWLHDHKTLGKDREIADGEVEIWRHIQPEGMTQADVFVELRPAGQLQLRLDFDPSPEATSSGASVSSGEGQHRMARTLSHVTSSRFSMRSSRPRDEDIPRPQ